MKLKRIAAIATALVLALGALPMVATAETLDAKVYYWDNGTSTFLDTSETDLTGALSGYSRILVNNTPSSIVTDVNLSNVTLILNGGSITIESGGTLRVKELYTLDSAIVGIEAGGTLIVGKTVITDVGASGVSFERSDANSTVFANDDESPVGLTPGADIITLAGNATIRNYSQKQAAGAKLDASAFDLTLEETNVIKQELVSSGKLIINSGTTAIDSTATANITGDVAVSKGELIVKTAIAALKSLEVGTQGTFSVYADTAIDGAGTLIMNGNLNINSGAKLALGTGASTIAGTVNITGAGSKLILGNAATLTGRMNINNGSILDLNAKTLTSSGTIYFDVSGELITNGNTAAIDLGSNGKLWFAYPAKYITTPGQLNIIGQKSAYVFSEDWETFKKSIFNNGAYTGYYDYYFARNNNSYTDSIVANSPTLTPSSNVYNGVGDFVIYSNGFYNNFDPNASLYANNVKLTAGQDYDYQNRSGYVSFTIFESTMRQYSGNVVFRATFKNGTSSSTTVTVSGAYIPPDLDISAPKTGTQESALGLALIMFAGLALVAVKKARTIDS